MKMMAGNDTETDTDFNDDMMMMMMMMLMIMMMMTLVINLLSLVITGSVEGVGGHNQTIKNCPDIHP